jgi:hypothetical protein
VGGLVELDGLLGLVDLGNWLQGQKLSLTHAERRDVYSEEGEKREHKAQEFQVHS